MRRAGDPERFVHIRLRAVADSAEGVLNDGGADYGAVSGGERTGGVVGGELEQILYERCWQCFFLEPFGEHGDELRLHPPW